MPASLPVGSSTSTWNERVVIFVMHWLCGGVCKAKSNVSYGIIPSLLCVAKHPMLMPEMLTPSASVRELWIV